MLLGAGLFVAIYVEVAGIVSWRLITFYAFFLCSNYRHRLVPHCCGSVSSVNSVLFQIDRQDVTLKVYRM